MTFDEFSRLVIATGAPPPQLDAVSNLWVVDTPRAEKVFVWPITGVNLDASVKYAHENDRLGPCVTTLARLLSTVILWQRIEASELAR